MRFLQVVHPVNHDKVWKLQDSLLSSGAAGAELLEHGRADWQLAGI